MTEVVASTPMRLQVLLPTEILVDEVVNKIVAEGYDGVFCLLPRHIDFVSALVPGVLCFTTPAGREEFAAIDEGVLVKCGPDVSVSVWDGVRGSALASLRALIDERFTQLDEHERRARTALARLEGGTLRRFLEVAEMSRA